MTLSIKLESVTSGGVSAPFLAVAAPDLAETKFQRKGNLVTRVDLGFLDVPDDDGGAALTFQNVKPGYVVPLGLESIWRTSGP